MLTGARLQARTAFEKGRALQPGSEEFRKGVEHAESVAMILRQNVVQGEAEGEGEHYSRTRSHGHRIMTADQTQGCGYTRRQSEGTTILLKPRGRR